jgi:hypothetical protein
MFLPLGARWSVDAWRSGSRERAPQPAGAVRSVASAALVLQLAAVYLGAGLAKCNTDWFAGDALAHALSVHDHGTVVGMALGSLSWLTRPLQWGVLLVEIGLPLILLAVPRAVVRGTIVALFIAFHASIWLAMTVGLFAAIGIVAWLPLIPAAAWPRRRAEAAPAPLGLGRAATWACGLAGLVAMASFLHQVTPLAERPLPRPLVAAINLCCLPQEWAMFGGVSPQEQWVYGRGLLADGSLVDLLRGGRPLEELCKHVLNGVFRLRMYQSQGSTIQDQAGRVGLEVRGGPGVRAHRQHRTIKPAAGNERFGVEQERAHRKGAGGHVGAVCRGRRA